MTIIDNVRKLDQELEKLLNAKRIFKVKIDASQSVTEKPSNTCNSKLRKQKIKVK